MESLNYSVFNRPCDVDKENGSHKIKIYLDKEQHYELYDEFRRKIIPKHGEGEASFHDGMPNSFLCMFNLSSTKLSEEYPSKE
jgi:hypothetical protein